MLSSVVSQYFLIFFAGIAGSFHCVGMCGAIACALAPDPRGRAATLWRHLLYNSGRLFTYVFLGVLVGMLGGSVFRTALAQQALAVVSGLLMLIIGLQFLGFLQNLRGSALGVAGASMARAMRSLLSAPQSSAPLVLGLLNGFLPCPLVYAFLAKAAASDGPLTGLTTMFAFGLGTFPVMLLLGATGTMLRPLWRQRGMRLAGVFIFSFGVITLARVLVPYLNHSHS